MTLCYGLSALYFVLTAVGIVLTVVSAGRPEWLLVYWVLTACLYFLTETCVIFYFVGTGVSVRDYVEDHSLDDGHHRRSLFIKRRVLPATMLNTCLMLGVYASFGAVSTQRLSVWLWVALATAVLLHWAAVKRHQHWGFREMTRTILTMTGILHPLRNGS